MGGATKAVAAFATSFGILVLLKDGYLERLIGDAAQGAKDLAGGLKPITRVG